MDVEILKSEKAYLYRSDLRELRGESRVLHYGSLLICRSGFISLHVDFQSYNLETGSVIILFPGDVICIDNVSDDFEVELLRYDRALLREASLQLERTVYSLLRQDRCMGGEKTVLEIFEGIFNLLRIYFQQTQCGCKDQLVLYLLKTFFLGFYDYIKQNRIFPIPVKGSRRTNELFNTFMETLERDYKVSQNVAYYAKQLNITPKYLNNIAREISGQSPKAIIDHYVTLQIKLNLRTSNITIKEMAWQYHFSDVSFFCRHFRQRTGMTPQEYRHKYRDE